RRAGALAARAARAAGGRGHGRPRGRLPAGLDAEEGAMSPSALRCAGLRVSLGGREVLQGVALALPAGRWTAVAGPNVAGKTTLLKALAQLLPAQGRVELFGRPVATWSSRERARTLAWLGQAEGGSADLLARDVVMLGRLPHQDWLAAPSAQDEEAVRAAM